MRVKKSHMKNKGFGLVEVVIGSAIIVAGILAAIYAYNTYVQYALANQGNIQASYLLEEGMESMSFLRDKGWTSKIGALSTTTTYYLSFNGSYWVTTTTPQYVDGIFLRSIGVSDVKRNASDVISASGTYDPNTKQVTATLSYFQGHATTTQTMSTYITNLWSN